MRFSLSQSIAAPIEDVAAAYAGEDLYTRLGPTEKLGAPEVLDRAEDGDLVTLRIRYHFVGDLAPAVTAVVERDRLSWVERSVHDLEARRVEVELLPDHYADRLRCTGTYRYRAEGRGTRRDIEGELKVRALLVAGAVERAIVSGLEEHLVAEARAVEDYLASGA